MERMSVQEAARAGLSRVIREAERDGAKVITRFDAPIAIVLPLTVAGQRKLQERLQHHINEVEVQVLLEIIRNV